MLDIEQLTKPNVIEALEIIKSVCFNNTCTFCPFGGDYCHIKRGDPEQWEIDINTIWRAFK